MSPVPAFPQLDGPTSAEPTSPDRQKHYLREMGIAVWEVSHPERLAGYQAPEVMLPNECELLLVAEDCPEGEDASLFIKVLASMKLLPEQARHLTPAQAEKLASHSLKWVWFAGLKVESMADAEKWQSLNVLQSPLLENIHGNTLHRRHLWQQICAYN
ncbi:MAG: DNA polymerase III subunit psi [Vibrio sp.]